MSADAELAASEITDDGLLNGRLHLLQPRRGHRFGHDAVLLAAAVDAKAGQHAIDFGAGVGAAGLALAARVPGLNITLVERDPSLSALAADNIERNNFVQRARAITLDVLAAPSEWEKCGVPSGSADHVLMNPPFNPDGSAQPSPDLAKRAAHHAGDGLLRAWLEAAHTILRDHGCVTLIWRTERYDFLTNAMAGLFGASSVMPVLARAGTPPIRLLVRAIKDASGNLKECAPLELETAPGQPSARANDILRAGATLRFA